MGGNDKVAYIPFIIGEIVPQKIFEKIENFS